MKRNFLWNIPFHLGLSLVVVGSAGALAGCKEDHGQTHDATPPPATSTKTEESGDNHANAVPLGEKSVNGMTFAASQDEPATAGGEAAFDLKITGYTEAVKPKAVRFWVGAESGEGSVKAKAEEETPDNWHTHTEVPDPLPAGSKFWAEVEPAMGRPFTVSFDLKK